MGIRPSAMESVAMMEDRFWNGKRVLITGHTGFKGGWLSLWLTLKGAAVTGYALDPPTDPNFYSACDLEGRMNSVIGDIRDLDKLKSVVLKTRTRIAGTHGRPGFGEAIV